MSHTPLNQSSAALRGAGAARRGAGAVRAGGGVAAGAIAVLLATAPAGEGGPAAALAWEDGTLLSRLLAQLDSLGLAEVHVLTRPEWADVLAPSVAGATAAVRLHTPADLAGDLQAIADVAATAPGELVVAYADVVTHREALAGLLADPRIRSGILSTGGRTGRPYAFRVRSRRGRVVSAGSPFHAVHRPTGQFLGVLKVSPADRPVLVEQARRLSALVADPPASWREELDAKATRWRLSLARHALGGAHEVGSAGGERVGTEDPPERRGFEREHEHVDIETLLALELPPDSDAELHRRVDAAPNDAAALLLVGLVRGGVHLNNSYLRTLFWARPLSRDVVERAAERIGEYDEDKVLLDSAVKATDGFFTTFFVSPYSRYIARWAARRGFTPNQITTFSLAIGVAAAAAFGTGERWGLIAGAILLQLAFTFDCVDGQLARYTRRFSKLGAWLDSVFDRAKEYVVFAGLAIGASRTGDPVWLLAGAALTLQTVRHTFDFSFGATAHQAIGEHVQPPIEEPGDGTGPSTAAALANAIERSASADAEPAAAENAVAPTAPRQPVWRRASAQALRVWRHLDRFGAIPWIKRMVAFPIGERFAAISLTAAIWSAHTTFVVLLVWGGVAACYTLAGRLLRSFAR